MSSGFSHHQAAQLAANLFGSLSSNNNSHFLDSPSCVALRNASTAAGVAAKLKAKRARQRVDAGEPRNTYSSIPNYTSGRTSLQGGVLPTSGSMLTNGTPHRSSSASSTKSNSSSEGNQPPSGLGGAEHFTATSTPTSFPPPMYADDPASILKSFGASFGYDFQQQNAAAFNASPVAFFGPQGLLRMQFAAAAALAGQQSKTLETPKEVEDDEDENDAVNHEETDHSLLVDPNGCETANGDDEEEDDEEVEESRDEEGGEEKPNVTGVSSNESVDNGDTRSGTTSVTPNSGSKSKRKQYQPRQHASDLGEIVAEVDESVDETKESATLDEEKKLNGETKEEVESKKLASTNASEAKSEPFVDEELKKLQQMQPLMEMFWPQGRRATPASDPSPQQEYVDLKELKQMMTDTLNAELKASLSGTVTATVTAIVEKTVEKIFAQHLDAAKQRKLAAATAEKHHHQQQQMAAAQRSPASALSGQAPPFYIHPFAAAANAYYGGGFPYGATQANFMQSAFGGHHVTPPSTIFPNFQSLSAAASYAGAPTSKKRAVDVEEAISLVMPKKKRSKVTDTRITRVTPGHSAASLLQLSRATSSVGVTSTSSSFLNSATRTTPPSMVVPSHLLNASSSAAETSVVHNGFSTGNSSIADRNELDSPITELDSNDACSDFGPYDNSAGTTSTLTPMHLRKAKLMFFYTRYPSSALLKAYFQDIRFNKNNTAQLVKWFSNFREFYYIQMEKYARQALAEGVRLAEEIHVRDDSEIYRVLNLHYNRNNHIQVPTNFRAVVEATLREFFRAIQVGRDAEPSWKKQIYKIIARLDDPIPEYFKSSNFLEQLE